MWQCDCAIRSGSMRSFCRREASYTLHNCFCSSFLDLLVKDRNVKQNNINGQGQGTPIGDGLDLT